MNENISIRLMQFKESSIHLELTVYMNTTNIIQSCNRISYYFISHETGFLRGITESMLDDEISLFVDFF